MKFFLLLALCFVGFYDLSAQREQYSLLWEISGNGLQKPSYLFGTMHVRDERAFDFPDSLLTVLHNCEAFAMECNLDSVLLSIFSEPDDEEEDSSKWLINQLDTAELEQLRGRTRQLFGTEMEDLPNYNPIQMNYLFGKGGAEMPGQKDRSTFLDLYLYDIANREGKQLRSLERPDSYNDLFLFSFFKKEKKDGLPADKNGGDSDISNEVQFAKMFELYYEGKAEQLEQFMTENVNAEYLEELLFKRNIGMAKEIDRLLKEHSTFIAVGAGHLSGGKGLIHLLRARGYKVRRVTPQFSGKAKNYVVEEKRDKWQTHDVPGKGYSVEVPATLYPIYVEGLKILDPHFAMDWGNTVNYMTMCKSSETPMFPDAAAKKKTIKNMYDNMKAQQQFLIRRKTDLGNEEFPGVEVAMSDYSDRFFYRFQVWVGDYGLYLLMCSSQDSTASVPDQDRFFKSLKCRKPGPSAVQEVVAHWQKFAKKDQPFSVLAPQKLKLNLRESLRENIDAKLYETIFNNAEFGVFVWKLPPDGSSQTLKDTLMAAMVDQYSSTFGELVYLDSLSIDGFDARTAHYKHMGGITQLKMALRKNVLLIAYTSAKDTIADKFMSSFHVNQMAQPVFGVPYKTRSFAAHFPKKPVWDEIDYFDRYKFISAKQVEAFDISSNSYYNISQYTLNPYQYFEDSAAFITAQNPAWGFPDSFKTDAATRYRGRMAQERTYLDNISACDIREHKILTGTHLYVLTARTLSDFPTQTDSFFNSLNILEKEAPRLTKEQMLREAMRTIVAGDSANCANAIFALHGYDIPPDVADTLLLALSNPRIGNEDKQEIIAAISMKKTDWATAKFSAYLDKPSMNDTLKCKLLGALCKQGSAEAYRRVIKYLREDLIVANEWQQWEIYFHTRDSLVMQDIYPELLDLATNSPLWGFKAIDALEFFSDSSHFLDARLEQNGQSFSELLLRLSKLGLVTDEDYDFDTEEGRAQLSLFSLLRLKKKMQPRPQDKASLEAIVKAAEPGYLKLQGMELLYLKFNEISKKDVDALSKNAAFFNLYLFLKEKNQLNRIPKKYLKQAFLVRFLLNGAQEYNEIMLEEKTTQQLDVRHLEYKGQAMRSYLYSGSITYDEGTEQYLVILGPQPNDDRQFERNRFICRFYNCAGKMDKAFIEQSYGAFLEDLKTVDLEEEGFYMGGDY